MPRIDEDKSVWRYRYRSITEFDKLKVNDVERGVKVTLGRFKGTYRWGILNFIFEKERFKTCEQISGWIEQHVKTETRTAMDHKVWNEYRKMLFQLYMEISHIS
ncbi:MAG: hypothetical protein ABSC20_09620 [Candidatus Bathyarchaeia archaeon]|jgi:hypothetical protein